MTYTLGATTSDGLSAAITASFFAQNVSTLCAGWWYPTTLTNGRRLFGTASGGNNNALEIANSTDLRWRTSNSTTRADYAISGIPLTTGEWWFIALYSVRGASSESLAVWQATSQIPPTRMTVTNTVAGSGNFTNLVTFQIGNEGGQTQAFQGDVGWVFLTNLTSPAVEGPLLTTSTQTATAAELDFMERSIVTKLWNGTADWSTIPRSILQGGVLQFPLDDFATPATPTLFYYNRAFTTQSFTAVSFLGSPVRTEARPPSIIPWPKWNTYTPRTAAR